MELYNSNSEKHPYSLTVQGKLLNSTKITKIQKVSSTKAKIIWKNLGNVTGYELLRKNYGGSYKKVATITLEPGCDEYNRILQLQLKLYSDMEYPENIADLEKI